MSFKNGSMKEHLNGFLAKGGGNLNNDFQESMLGRFPWGSWRFDLTDTLRSMFGCAQNLRRFSSYNRR